MIINIIKDFEFEASYRDMRLPSRQECRIVSGHLFRIGVCVTGQVDPQTGIFMDHAKISEVVRPIILKLENTVLNESMGLKNASIELMAKWFWERIFPHLSGLTEIRVQETPYVQFIYRGQ